MEKLYTIERSQQMVLALLKAHGIRRIIASPGTTNLTLVASAQKDPYFIMYSSVDERSAAYMACGMAAETGEPIVLSCTGATASRNYLPGMTEAYYRKLPILAITANQGREKVGHLVAQNIDRSVVANDAAVMSVNVPPCRTSDDEWHCELMLNKAMLELRRNGGGPVHIDLSTTYSRDYSAKELPSCRVIRRYGMCDTLPEIPQGSVAVFIGSHATMTKAETKALDNFCEKWDAVALCDHTSGYYGKYRVPAALVMGQVQYRTPLANINTLIHIGEVSGDYYGLSIAPNQVWRVNPDGELRDTFRRLSAVFEMDCVHFFNEYSKDCTSKPSTRLEAYKAEYAKVFKSIPELPFSNVWIAQQTAPHIPYGSVVHLGILNTLRSWNFFEFASGVQSFCNVGGFGIDGNMSSLIGAALASPHKIFYGIIGDLAFFYDMNALGNRHVPNNLRIMLINNGRGTEFRNYQHPGHDFGATADPFIAAAGHFGNKSPQLVKHYAEDLGFTYYSASNKETYLQMLTKFLSTSATNSSVIFEIFTDSNNESDALQKILNCVKPESTSRTTTLYRAARKLKRLITI